MKAISDQLLSIRPDWRPQEADRGAIRYPFVPSAARRAVYRGTGPNGSYRSFACFSDF